MGRYNVRKFEIIIRFDGLGAVERERIGSMRKIEFGWERGHTKSTIADRSCWADEQE